MKTRNRKLARKTENKTFTLVNVLKAIGVGILCAICPPLVMLFIMNHDD